jgi:hypothetical protein
MQRVLVAGVCVVAVACGGSSPSSPTAAETPRVLQGQTVSAIDGNAASQVSVQIANHSATQSDADGNFQIDIATPGTFGVILSGSGVVERRTSLTAPARDRTRVSLIPAGFDLAAFDELARGNKGRLQRWTSRPALVIVGTVMKFSPDRTDRFEALGERMTNDEVTGLTEHLTEGLALLTGGTYTSFASVKVEWPAAGEQVDVQRTGTIVAGRYSGIEALTQAIGLGNRAEQPDGSVAGGTIWLDRDFERNEVQRRLVRIHELGHALGYNHVTVRTSLMNPALGPSPTEFDRAAAVIAFQRPVGNTSPDTDPGAGFGTSTFVVTDGPMTWSPPVR